VREREKRIAAALAAVRADGLDPHYLAYFACFNRQAFFEAHEVLEELRLLERAGPKGRFYQGLIQLAGAFVHLQKRRPQPAAALFRLAKINLDQYPAAFEGLDVTAVCGRIDRWLAAPEAAEANPRLALDGPRGTGRL
jgi:uncharacterized protein